MFGVFQHVSTLNHKKKLGILVADVAVTPKISRRTKDVQTVPNGGQLMFVRASVDLSGQLWLFGAALTRLAHVVWCCFIAYIQLPCFHSTH